MDKNVKEKVNNLWNNIDKIGVIFSIFVSTAALIISIRSCNDSSIALEINKKEFNSKREIVLEDEDIDSFIDFRPIDKSQRLQSINISLPDIFTQKNVFIDAPDFSYNYGRIEFIISDTLNKLIKTPKKGTNVVLALSVPLFVRSTYVSAGEKLEDYSIYKIDFRYIYEIDSENHIYKDLELKNLSFIKHLGIEFEYIKEINEMWNNEWEKIYNEIIEINIQNE